ncbi:hypothetical protein SAMN06265346_11095 [Flavobacterium hercynium]|nr:hypothetical protein SAMN06265346_11095 [Flavobacterium hercynium]
MYVTSPKNFVISSLNVINKYILTTEMECFQDTIPSNIKKKDTLDFDFFQKISTIGFTEN